MTDINKFKEKEILKGYEGEDRVLHSADIKKALEEERFFKPSLQIFSQIPKLDETIGGCFNPGQLVVVSGQTGRGKSSLLQTLTFNFAEQGIKSLWLSFELTYQDLFKKFDFTGLPLPEFYLPKAIKYQDMKWLRDRLIESIAKYGTKVMFIDDLHSLLPFNCQDNTTEIANRIRLLKSLALEFEIVIIVAVAVKRELQDIVPSENDLRDSSVIGDRSDLVIFIWRKTEKQTKEQKENEGLKFKGNESVLYVAKNRPTGKRDFVPLNYISGIFKEINFNLDDDKEITL